jgi:glyoxalase family protein
MVLTQVLNMHAARVYATAEQPPLQTHVYEMGTGGAAAELHVAVDPTLPVARQGAGGVHHVAFRVPDRAALEDWTARLNAVRLPNSGEVERYYFRSLYFREPNGILFELATDGPGFAVDEDISELGERLALPPFLEPQRAAIEEGLAPLDLPTATTAAERAS